VESHSHPTASAATSGGDSPLAELAVVRRSGVIESRHFGSLTLLAADGSVAATLGDSEADILPRSTVKPLQALACLLAGAELSGPELAIAGASHTGEDEHVEMVRRILEKAGLDESALGCPVDWPEDGPTRERLILAGEGQARIRMNCSGKHAAMLLACVANGWDTDSYLDPEHPLQVLVRETIERVTGVPITVTAVDGCGAPLFNTTVTGLAAAFRALVTAEEGTHERAVADAMRENPFFVGGHNHANTQTMELVPGVLAKGGAEGVIAAAASTGEAVSMKIIDGNPRATTLIALTALASLGVDTSHTGNLTVLPILGGGVRVGQLEVGSDLEALLANASGARSSTSTAGSAE
jgi:L-asparaginase II